MGHIGEIAALGAVLGWTGTALFFEAAGRRIGSLAVNIIRLVIALLYFVPVSLYLAGKPFPWDAGRAAWTWLALSALFGFLIGDMSLFRAFLVIGPRRSVTMMSLVPPISALIGWILMGELLRWWEWIGMGVAIGGVLLVVLDRHEDENGVPRRIPPAGLALGFFGALGQAVGLVFSKKGMEGGLDPFLATHVRVLVGAVLFAIVFTAIGWWPKVAAGLRDRRALLLTACGAFLGPFFGVSMSLLAVKHTETGVAATIMALVPVTLIPAVIFLKHERVSARGWAGAALAVGGVALMFLD